MNITNSSPHKTRLAPKALPRFNTNIQGWQSFFFCYKVMVYYDDNYPTAQKFSCLWAILSGKALDIYQRHTDDSR